MNRLLLLFLSTTFSLFTASQVHATAVPIPVVASFSILGDMVQSIGGEAVHVTTLVGPNGDAHVYQPTPHDAKAVALAQLVVVNGLGFEGWMSRLVRSSGFTGQMVVATEGVVPRDNHGVADPHAWQDLRNGMVYVRNIERALIAVDPLHATAYQAHAKDYLTRLDTLDREVRTQLAALPAENRRFITSHDAFGYFAAAYGLTLLAPVGASTDAEASAADVAALVRQIRREQVKAVFMENITDPRLVQRIAAETGAVMGGTLYSDALSDVRGPAATYLAMFHNNLQVLVETLTPTVARRDRIPASPP